MSNLSHKAVLFDLDGVLLDSMQHHADAWLRVMGEAGLGVDREFILAHEGCLQTNVLQGLLCKCGLEPEYGPDEFMAELLEKQRALFLAEYAHLVAPYPRAAGLLQALRGQEVPLALVTSSRRDQVHTCLPQDMLSCFETVVASDDVAAHKPHPEPYLRAAQALGLAAGECLVVENAPAGIASAVAAGATCYALSTTLSPEHLTQAHAVFASLGHLADHLGCNGNG
ncbi:MAG: HAD family phosphatase [Desulfarculaceae bacterium]|nr:HAD family phosphatase [Desulfarculaceae bacterium]MCF8073473.1 HAD family phosphatase [Desulfarculaceae bacterium]MCF8100380.1 HAD family phosphatase [Desulfarculaceae bacterium]MCF8115884.1 HAD family phosphatase [Desulfarculaceae bacterium]